MGKKKTVKKEFGDSIILTGRSIVDNPKTIIPISPALNLITSGGIPEGSFVIVTGKQKLGKTSLCLDFAATAQLPEYNYNGSTREVIYYNIEGRLKKRDIEGIKHLNPDTITIVGSTKEKILYAEDYIDIFLKDVHSKPGAILILDSVSQLCSAARRDNAVGERFRDDVPIMLADLTKRVSNILPINDNIVICITHVIANTGGGPQKWSEASGQKIQYQCDVKLRCTHSEAYPTNGDQLGQIVHWNCETSAVGPPNRKGTSLLRYGHGLDCEYELATIAMELGLINQKGAWYAIDEKTVAQGIENLVIYLKENKDVYNSLYEQFISMTGLTSVTI